MESLRNLNPANWEALAFQRIQALIPAKANLCVAVSGGLDSMVLLHLLHRFSQHHPLRLSAIHVNHQLQPQADGWQQFVERQCQALGVPLHAIRVRVQPDAGLGLEAAARQARYQAFAQVDADYLALAQHQDDQVETLWLQLIRGAGAQGLAAMPSVRSHHSLQLIRPLLSFSREALEQYANQRQISHVEDPSNQDQQLVRNFLRHQLGPLLSGRFPAWRQTMARSAELLGESSQLLAELAQSDLLTCEGAQGVRVESALALGEPRAANLLRFWLNRQGARAPASGRLREWLRQSRAARHRQPQLEWDGWTLSRHRGCWQLHRPAVSWNALELDGPPAVGNYPLPDGSGVLVGVNPGNGPGLRSELPRGTWQFRCRVGGERIRPRRGGPSRTLKNLLLEAGVPAWQRGSLPLLYLDDRLVAVPGLAIEAEFQSQDRGLALAWQPPQGDL